MGQVRRKLDEGILQFELQALPSLHRRRSSRNELHVRAASVVGQVRPELDAGVLQGLLRQVLKRAAKCTASAHNQSFENRRKAWLGSFSKGLLCP